MTSVCLQLLYKMDPSLLPLISALASGTSPSAPFLSVVPLSSANGLPFGFVLPPSPLLPFGAPIAYPMGGFPFGPVSPSLRPAVPALTHQEVGAPTVPGRPVGPPPGFPVPRPGCAEAAARDLPGRSRPHTCWCGRRFDTVSQLQQHGAKHAVGFGCEFCRKIFRTLMAMRQHRNDSHSALLNASVPRKPTVSPRGVAICPVSGPGRKPVGSHSASVGEANRAPLYSGVVRGQHKCMFDGKCFPSAEALSLHLSVCPSFKV